MTDGLALLWAYISGLVTGGAGTLTLAIWWVRRRP